jgi:predicted MFS family arabinose efflux permease
MGFLFTGYSISAGLSVLVWGPLSDLFGRKRGLTIGLCIFAMGSTISALSFSYGSLFAGRVVTGLGASMLSLNTLAYAADFFPYEVRGRAMSWIVSSYFAALIFGVPIGSLIGDRLGWNAVFAVAAVTAVLLVLSTHWLLPGRNATNQSARNAGTLIFEPIRNYASFIRTPRTFGALLSSMCASAGTMGFLAFLGVWLHDAFGIAGRQIGLVFLASGMAALLASPFAGLLSDKIGKRLQFIVSNAALAALLLILPDLRWGPALFLVFGALSLAAAFRQGPMEALLTEVAPPAVRGSFVALKNSFSQLGIGLAASASGLLFEHRGYVAVCLLCAVANVLAAAGMAIFVRERHL